MVELRSAMVRPMTAEPLYRATFTTPEDWSVEVAGDHGTDLHAFLIAEGRTTGRISARYRGANYPRRRADGVFLPDFRGVLETDDGASILFEWHGYTLPAAAGVPRRLVGTITHLADDDRYHWLTDVVCVLRGEVRPRAGTAGFDVVIEVTELDWQPLGD